MILSCSVALTVSRFGKESFCFPSLARPSAVVCRVLHIPMSLLFSSHKRQLGHDMLRLEATTRLEVFDDTKGTPLSLARVGGEELTSGDAAGSRRALAWLWVGLQKTWKSNLTHTCSTGRQIQNLVNLAA